MRAAREAFRRVGHLTILNGAGKHVIQGFSGFDEDLSFLYDHV